MSQDQVSVTTNTSWFSRIGGAIKGVVIGFVLIAVSIFVLSWNEGRSIQSIRSNNEGARAVLSVNASTINPANEGKLVHLTGPAIAGGARNDSQLGVSAEGLILARAVEYFQWTETSSSETRTKLGGGQETVTTYSYNTQWSSMPQDSSSFNQQQGHQNPVPTIKDSSFAADQAMVGAYRLDADGVNYLSADQVVALNAEQARSVGAALSRPAAVSDNVIYVGNNPASPQVGDMKITYRVVPENTVVSVVGAQTQGTVRPYQTKAGNPVMMVSKGTLSADEMFQGAKAANQMLTWVLRGVGIVVAITAISLILAPLGVLGDVVPFIGSIVRMGTGLVAFLVGLALSLIVIAVSWIVFRPLVGIGLLVVAGALIAGFIYLRRKKAQTLPPAATA